MHQYHKKPFRLPVSLNYFYNGDWILWALPVILACYRFLPKVIISLNLSRRLKLFLELTTVLSFQMRKDDKALFYYNVTFYYAWSETSESSRVCRVVCSDHLPFSICIMFEVCMNGFNEIIGVILL